MQYSIISYSHHAVPYIPMTYLFYSWKFVSLTPPSPILTTPHPQPLFYLWACFFVCLIFKFHIYKWDHTVFVFHWLISLSIMPSKPIHVVSNGKVSFFYGLIVFYYVFFIHLSISGHLGCFHILTIVSDAAMNMWAHLCGLVFLFSSDKCPEVELLSHMVVLFLIFWGTSTLFSIVTVPVYIPTSNAQQFPFPNILANVYY